MSGVDYSCFSRAETPEAALAFSRGSIDLVWSVWGDQDVFHTLAEEVGVSSEGLFAALKRVSKGIESEMLKLKGSLE